MSAPLAFSRLSHGTDLRALAFARRGRGCRSRRSHSSLLQAGGARLDRCGRAGSSPLPQRVLDGWFQHLGHALRVQHHGVLDFGRTQPEPERARSSRRQRAAYDRRQKEPPRQATAGLRRGLGLLPELLSGLLDARCRSLQGFGGLLLVQAPRCGLLPAGLLLLGKVCRVSSASVAKLSANGSISAANCSAFRACLNRIIALTVDCLPIVL